MARSHLAFGETATVRRTGGQHFLVAGGRRIPASQGSRDSNKPPRSFTEEEVRWASVRVRKGQSLPALPVATLDGTSGVLSSLLEPGRPTLVNLWATWCIPCRREMPELERLHQSAGERGIRVIGVSIDDAMTRDHVPGFVKEMGVTYPIVVAEAEFIRNLYTTDNVTVPISVLLDAEGIITDLLPGWTPETREHLEALSSPRNLNR